VAHPTGNLGTIGLAQKEGGVALAREALKHRKYDGWAATNGGGFVPLVFETYGALGEEASRFVKKIDRALFNLHPEVRDYCPYIKQRLSVALQNGNGEIMAAGLTRSRARESGRRRSNSGVTRGMTSRGRGSRGRGSGRGFIGRRAGSYMNMRSRVMAGNMIGNTTGATGFTNAVTGSTLGNAAIGSNNGNDSITVSRGQACPLQRSVSFSSVVADSVALRAPVRSRLGINTTAVCGTNDEGETQETVRREPDLAVREGSLQRSVPSTIAVADPVATRSAVFERLVNTNTTIDGVATRLERLELIEAFCGGPDHRKGSPQRSVSCVSSADFLVSAARLRRRATPTQDSVADDESNSNLSTGSVRVRGGPQSRDVVSVVSDAIDAADGERGEARAADRSARGHTALYGRQQTLGARRGAA
jgi:hypothetical protein